MIPQVIAILNHKGGVGKTTTTFNLSKALSLMTQKVLMIDIDPQANLTIITGEENPKKSIYDAFCDDEPLPIINVAPNLDLVPASLDLSAGEAKFISMGIAGYFKLKNGLANIKKNYDYVFIDCPPSLGILTLNSLIASDSVIIVLNPEFLSIKGLTTIVSTIDNLNKDLNLSCSIMGYLITQTERTLLSKGFEGELKKTFKKKVFENVIRRSVALKEATASKKDIFSYNRNSTGALDYLELAKEILVL